MTLFDWWDKHMVAGTILVVVFGLALIDAVGRWRK